jgi:hypothetical protein
MRRRAVTGMACFNSRLTSLTTRTPPHADQPSGTAGRRSSVTPTDTLARMRLDELERRLRAHLDALGADPRAELLHVLMVPDFERAGRIREFWS